MRVSVIIFPGSNREPDLCAALQRATGRPPNRVWHGEGNLPEHLDLIVLPGGFAYGDYLRVGAMAAHSPIMREVKARADCGTPVLGICNGFQVLTEAGMLPGALLTNRNLSFVCRDVHLRVDNDESVFTCGYSFGQILRVPVAHHDGSYSATPATLNRLEDRGLVAFRYCGASGAITDSDNFNGSARAIAGIFNETRTVLGLMPHPENATDPLLGSTDGQPFFEGLVGALSGRMSA
jgi:phosphoribosylformylglycinamidine synthase subunit PurQ / glutaminase